MKLTIITIDGSITKETTILEDADPSWTILAVKLLIQGRDKIPPRQRHTVPFTAVRDGEPHVDFARMFCNGKELLEDEKTLQEYGVEDESTIRFAVPRSLAADLRKCLNALIEKYPNDDSITATSAIEKGDDTILAFLLDLDLKHQMRVREAAKRRWEARSRGEQVEVQVRKGLGLGLGAIEKELYNIFDPAVLPVRFYLLGENGTTPYVGFAVDANKTNYRSKTCCGIPVTLMYHSRIKQSASSQAESKGRKRLCHTNGSRSAKKQKPTHHSTLERRSIVLSSLKKM